MKTPTQVPPSESRWQRCFGPTEMLRCYISAGLPWSADGHTEGRMPHVSDLDVPLFALPTRVWVDSTYIQVAAAFFAAKHFPTGMQAAWPSIWHAVSNSPELVGATQTLLKLRRAECITRDALATSLHELFGLSYDDDHPIPNLVPAVGG